MAMETIRKFEGGSLLQDESGNDYIKLNDVILNFPSLLKKKKFKTDKGDGNYLVRVLIPKDRKAVRDALLEVGKKLAAEKKLDWSKLKEDHKFLVDGNKSPYDEEDGFYVVKMKESRRPVVRLKNKEPLSPDDEGAMEKVYSGVHSDCIFGFYAYNNEYKGVKANPKSFRLLEFGEQFSNSGGVDDEELYDDDDDGDGFERDDNDDL